MEIYYGENICEGKTSKGLECTNKAYYRSQEKYLCGVHSRKDKTRVKLIKNPNAGRVKEDLFKTRQKIVEETAKRNKELGILGKVICTKLRMMKEPEHIDGYLKVFPNFKHQNRKDGFGCMSLSPKAMGPIDHGQIGLPIAKNLENFHQGNKVFPSEVDEKNNPTKQFYETQIKMYNDEIPHRHKTESKNKNVPLYSIWIDKGKEVRCSYFESRQFYSTYYERIAKTLPDFIKLKKLINEGYNIQICGYDAYPVTKSLEDHYKDTSKPFGHELVLYTLLVEVIGNYPWRKFKTFDF